MKRASNYNDRNIVFGSLPNEVGPNIVSRKNQTIRFDEIYDTFSISRGIKRDVNGCINVRIGFYIWGNRRGEIS
jgi:hypothetical protein